MTIYRNLQDKFNKQLSQGQYYERETLKYIPHEEAIFCNTKEYDIEVLLPNGDREYYETKTDRLCLGVGDRKATNNFPIEYQYKNQPSGIGATKADYFMLFTIDTNNNDKYNVYKIETKKLKEICKKCRRVSGGDNYNSKMFLVPISKIKEYELEYIE